MLSFKITHPTGCLSKHIQGIWSASVESEAGSVVEKPLYSDAGRGVLFNLGPPIVWGGEQFSTGIIVLPVAKQSRAVVLPQGAQLAGLRFLPAAGFDFMSVQQDRPVTLSNVDEASAALVQLFQTLGSAQTHHQRIAIQQQWLECHLHLVKPVPPLFAQALQIVEEAQLICSVGERVSLSQRQLERNFQQWLGMTPKYYQRILRVKRMLDVLKANPSLELSELALEVGFADQAHMTREIREFANTTPKRFVKQQLLEQALREENKDAHRM